MAVGNAAVWHDAPDDLVIAGGPISPRVLGGRPQWLADDLLGIFGAVDHGGRSRPIDGASVRLLAGNASLRVDAVAGLGGFWPMRGHPRLRGWYDSRSCSRATPRKPGGQSHWLPEARTERLIERPAHATSPARAATPDGALIGAVGDTRGRMTAAAGRDVDARIPVALVTSSEARGPAPRACGQRRRLAGDKARRTRRSRRPGRPSSGPACRGPSRDGAAAAAERAARARRASLPPRRRRRVRPCSD